MCFEKTVRSQTHLFVIIPLSSISLRHIQGEVRTSFSRLSDELVHRCIACCSLLPLLTRWMGACHNMDRDKYMFHQANIIPAGDVGDGSQSLLDYWYQRVMEDYSKWITFPVKVVPRS